MADLTNLIKVFEPIEGWRIDDFRGLQGANHDEVVANVTEFGKESPYCSVRDPTTGVNAVSQGNDRPRVRHRRHHPSCLSSAPTLVSPQGPTQTQTPLAAPDGIPP